MKHKKIYKERCIKVDCEVMSLDRDIFFTGYFVTLKYKENDKIYIREFNISGYLWLVLAHTPYPTVTLAHESFLFGLIKVLRIKTIHLPEGDLDG